MEKASMRLMGTNNFMIKSVAFFACFVSKAYFPDGLPIAHVRVHRGNA
jgi:hypothetical protein